MYLKSKLYDVCCMENYRHCQELLFRKYNLRKPCQISRIRSSHIESLRLYCNYFCLKLGQSFSVVISKWKCIRRITWFFSEHLSVKKKNACHMWCCNKLFIIFLIFARHVQVYNYILINWYLEIFCRMLEGMKQFKRI